MLSKWTKQYFDFQMSHSRISSFCFCVFEISVEIEIEDFH